MKNWTAAVRNAVAADQPRTELIKFTPNGGATTYLTTAAHDIDYLGNTYDAGGLLLDSGKLTQQKELRVQSLSLQFTAADLTIVAIFLNNNQQNREVDFTQVVLNDAHQVVGPVLSSKFVIDSHTIDDDEGQATITVKLSNFVADFEAIRGIRTTQVSHQRFYATSTAFINSKEIDKEIKWGGE